MKRPPILEGLTEGQSQYWIYYDLLGSITIWFLGLLVVVTAILPDFTLKIIENTLENTDEYSLAEFLQIKRPKYLIPRRTPMRYSSKRGRTNRVSQNDNTFNIEGFMTDLKKNDNESSKQPTARDSEPVVGRATVKQRDNELPEEYEEYEVFPDEFPEEFLEEYSDEYPEEQIIGTVEAQPNRYYSTVVNEYDGDMFYNTMV